MNSKRGVKEIVILSEAKGPKVEVPYQLIVYIEAARDVCGLTAHAFYNKEQ